jgi:hypothetical protein
MLENFAADRLSMSEPWYRAKALRRKVAQGAPDPIEILERQNRTRALSSTRRPNAPGYAAYLGIRIGYSIASISRFSAFKLAPA